MTSSVRISYQNADSADEPTRIKFRQGSIAATVVFKPDPDPDDVATVIEAIRKELGHECGQNFAEAGSQ